MRRAWRSVTAALAMTLATVGLVSAPAAAQAAGPLAAASGTTVPVVEGVGAADSPPPTDTPPGGRAPATTAESLAPAAGPSFHLDGGGWGHGVGMSQYGAYGRAQRGQTAEQILTFYYQGTQVHATSQPSGLRVWVAETDGASGVVLTSGAQPITLTSVNGPAASDPAGGSLRVTVAWGSLQIGATPVPGVDRVWVDLDAAAPVTVSPPAERFNRGRVEVILTPTGGLRVVVAKLSMQDYLYGIAEMPSIWPDQALRAQAIAARTYAMEKVMRAGLDRPSCSCSLLGTQGDQVYAGYEKEGGYAGDRWMAAVDSTDSVVVTYNGAPIQAFYSSSNGGYTEASEYAFVAALPYLRAQPDPDDAASPDHRWSRDYSQADLSRWLAAAPDTNVGTVLSLEILPPLTPSGRVGRVVAPGQGGVRITGTAGTVQVSGARFQTVVNTGVLTDGLGYAASIKSTLFSTTG